MIEQKSQHFAFTIKYTKRQSSLRSEAIIQCNGKQLRGVALWDTGATSSCISMNVVNELGLIPTGKTIVHTPSGQAEVFKYLVDIVLPNNVRIPDVPVCDSSIGLQKIDLLIGMDIIGAGDLSVSNINGTTSFSFCIPSKQFTDYVVLINREKLFGTHGKGKRKRK